MTIPIERKTLEHGAGEHDNGWNKEMGGLESRIYGK